MISRPVLSLPLLLGLLLLAGCTQSPAPALNSRALSASGPALTVSVYPLYLLTVPIAGSSAAVQLLLPPGAEPHNFEPTPSDVLRLSRASRLVYLSDSFETWLPGMLAGVPALPQTALLASVAPGSDDPHVWLSPKRARLLTPLLRDELIAADPANASVYAANAEAFASRLAVLDSDYSVGLSNCSTRTLLANHAFLGYIAVDYNLHALALEGVHEEAEPTPLEMASLLDRSRAAGVRAVFSEVGEGSALADSAAQELGVPTQSIDTLEVAPAGGSDPLLAYESRLRANLVVLRAGLGCS